MAARSGMSNLINHVRNLIDDGGSVVFTDDRIQDILDRNRVDFYQSQLYPIKQEVSGTIVYKVFKSDYTTLEGTVSGTEAFRLYDYQGDPASNYSIDTMRGVVTFASDQRGSARYLDGRSYDLNAAAADCWRERASKLVGGYDFKVEGRSYSRSQYFKHCADMVEYYSSMANPVTMTIERGDTI